MVIFTFAFMELQQRERTLSWINLQIILQSWFTIYCIYSISSVILAKW